MKKIQEIKNLINDINILSDDIQKIIVKNENDLDTITKLFYEMMVKNEICKKQEYNFIEYYLREKDPFFECCKNKHYSYLTFENSFICSIITDSIYKLKLAKNNIDINEFDKILEKSILSLENLINSIFPIGYQAENICYNAQIDDYAINFNPDKSEYLSRQDFPTLNDFRARRKNCIEEIIKDLTLNGFLEQALEAFKRNSYIYNISIRHIVVNIKNLDFSSLSRESLIYLMKLAESEVKEKYEQCFSCKKYLCLLIDSGKLDKKEWLYEQLIDATSTEEVINIVNELSDKIKQLDDTFLGVGIDLKARYYLSIVKIEFGDLLRDSEDKSIDDYQNFVQAVIIELEKRNEKFDREIIIPSIQKYTPDEKKKILKNFFNDGLTKIDSVYISEETKKVKEKEFPNIINKEKVNDNIVNEEEIKGEIEKIIDSSIDKISKNESLVNQIVGGEHLFKTINSGKIVSESKDNFLLSELPVDYTYLVASQIKSVERFLKECILKNLKNKRIYFGKGNKHYPNGSIIVPFNKLTNNSLKLDELNLLMNESGNFDESYFGKQELGSVDRLLGDLKYNYKDKDDKSNEHIYCYNGLKSIIFDRNDNYSIFSHFNDKNEFVYSEFYNNFIQKVRNGHFHTSVINKLEDVQKYRIETAFWLLCCIYELKGI